MLSPSFSFSPNVLNLICHILLNINVPLRRSILVLLLLNIHLINHAKKWCLCESAWGLALTTPFNNAYTPPRAPDNNKSRRLAQ